MIALLKEMQSCQEADLVLTGKATHLHSGTTAVLGAEYLEKR